jgi:hypothetical protein
MRTKIQNSYKIHGQRIVKKVNDNFNSLSRQAKKRTVIMFGVVSASICVATMTGIFTGGLKSLHSDSIVIPKTETPMEIKQSSNPLIPLGKMKGEVKGEFDSFYVAVDKDARVFINRNIRYDDTAYDKSESWKEISINELKQYERDLHFIPLSNKSKGLKP